MGRNDGPRPQPTPPDDDPTFGTSWAPGGSDRNAFMGQSLPGMSNTRMSWDGDSNPNTDASRAGGGGCLLISGLIAGAGIAAAFLGAKYGVGA